MGQAQQGGGQAVRREPGPLRLRPDQPPGLPDPGEHDPGVLQGPRSSSRTRRRWWTSSTARCSRRRRAGLTRSAGCSASSPSRSRRPRP